MINFLKTIWHCRILKRHRWGKALTGQNGYRYKRCSLCDKTKSVRLWARKQA